MRGYEVLELLGQRKCPKSFQKGNTIKYKGLNIRIALDVSTTLEEKWFKNLGSQSVKKICRIKTFSDEE